MEKIKWAGFMAMIMIMHGKIYAQNQVVIGKGLLNTQLTISPSYMFSERQSYFYLHGSVEDYLSSSISVAGEGYFYLGKLSGGTHTFKYNHSVFFGVSRHFVSNHHDLYFGLQPGLSITRLNEQYLKIVTTQAGVDPLISMIAGYNYYMNSVLHFFLQSRLILGLHNYYATKSLSELRFSAGLGFNLNLLKCY